MVRSFSRLMAAARCTSWESALASSATSAQAAAMPSMAMSSAGSPMPSRHSAATPTASSAAIVSASRQMRKRERAFFCEKELSRPISTQIFQNSHSPTKPGASTAQP